MVQNNQYFYREDPNTVVNNPEGKISLDITDCITV